MMQHHLYGAAVMRRRQFRAPRAKINREVETVGVGAPTIFFHMKHLDHVVVRAMPRHGALAITVLLEEWLERLAKLTLRGVHGNTKAGERLAHRPRRSARVTYHGLDPA